MFSHVGFVFGQPFIFEALGSDQTQSFAVIVSGSVSAAMMGVSLLASAVSKRLRQRLGLAGILLFAFGIQISINGVMAIENSIYLSAILLLRMVPDAFSRPYILAAVQPLLANDNRATYLSMQSFLGRVIFAVTLYGAATYSGGVSPCPMIFTSNFDDLFYGRPCKFCIILEHSALSSRLTLYSAATRLCSNMGLRYRPV